MLLNNSLIEEIGLLFIQSKEKLLVAFGRTVFRNQDRIC